MLNIDIEEKDFREISHSNRISYVLNKIENKQYNGCHYIVKMRIII